MNLTDLELKLINAIVNCEYGSEPDDAVWFWCPALEFDSAQISGVVGSAVKKDLVFVHDEGTDEHIIGLTKLGLQAYYNQ